MAIFEYHIGFPATEKEVGKEFDWSSWARLDFGVVRRSNASKLYESHDIEGGIGTLFTRVVTDPERLNDILHETSCVLKAFPGARAEIEAVIFTSKAGRLGGSVQAPMIELPAGIRKISEIPSSESHISLRNSDSTALDVKEVEDKVGELEFYYHELAFTKSYKKCIITNFFSNEEEMIGRTLDIYSEIFEKFKKNFIIKCSCEQVLGCYAAA